MFTREALLTSEWYRARLRTKQLRDMDRWSQHLQSVENYLQSNVSIDPGFRTTLEHRRGFAQQQLTHVSHPSYLEELVGTLGADPLGKTN